MQSLSDSSKLIRIIGILTISETSILYNIGQMDESITIEQLSNLYNYLSAVLIQVGLINLIPKADAKTKLQQSDEIEYTKQLIKYMYLQNATNHFIKLKYQQVIEITQTMIEALQFFRQILLKCKEQQGYDPIMNKRKLISETDHIILHKNLFIKYLNFATQILQLTYIKAI